MLSKNSAATPIRNDAKQSETMNRRRRGAEDMVHRGRSQIWLAVLKSHRKTPIGHNAMGAFFLPKIEDAGKIFALIEKHASDPGLVRISLGGKSVVDLVSAKEGFAHTKLNYDSALWKVLGPTLPTPWELEEMINDAIRQLILVEKWEDPPLELLVQAASICRLPIQIAAYRRVVRWAARKRSITCVLLLCLLYRRAIETGAVGEMRILREGVLNAVRHFCQRPGFSGAASTLFLFLVRRRVLAGQSALDHTPDVEWQADQFLVEWDLRCTTDAEYKWLGHQRWLIACALENLERTQAFEGPRELPTEVDRLLCESDLKQAMAHDPMARRLEQRGG